MFTGGDADCHHGTEACGTNHRSGGRAADANRRTKASGRTRRDDRSRLGRIPRDNGARLGRAGGDNSPSRGDSPSTGRERPVRRQACQRSTHGVLRAQRIHEQGVHRSF